MSSVAQKNVSFDTISYKYRIDSIYSNALNETRFIKIYMPDNFHQNRKYPVFFLLDEDWMFEPVVAYVKQLADAKIIPISIVVGVYSNNRSNDFRLDLKGGFTENNKRFTSTLPRT
jgi:predicted alpha/beta superfamily hydrolase